MTDMCGNIRRSNQPCRLSGALGSNTQSSVGFRGKSFTFHSRPRSSTITEAPACARRHAVTAPPNPEPMTMTSASAMALHREEAAVHVGQLAEEQAGELGERRGARGQVRAVGPERGELRQKVEKVDRDDPDRFLIRRRLG